MCSPCFPQTLQRELLLLLLLCYGESPEKLDKSWTSLSIFIISHCQVFIPSYVYTFTFPNICAMGRVWRNLVGFYFHTFTLAYFHTFLKPFLTPCVSEKTSLRNICSPLNVINHSRPAYVSLRSANLGQPMVTRPAMMLILKPNHHHGFFKIIYRVFCLFKIVTKSFFMNFSADKTQKNCTSHAAKDKILKLVTIRNKRHGSISKMVKKGEIQICHQL